ncbi:MAG: winged helix-turn-helix transcriptional regulator [Bacteroidetes bacterium]|nr:winged helix-turn-helix transcriptional regulator [Bacteroidota bacterium]
MASGTSGPLDRHIAAILERIGEVARADRWRQAAGTETTPLQARVLAFIGGHPHEGIGVARLAQELQVSRPTVSDCVKVLVEKGLLKRIADPRDARSHALVLSPKGRRHQAAIAPDPLDRSITGLGTADKEALLLHLMQVLRNLFTQGTIDVQRMCWTCAHYRGDRKGEHRCALLGIVMKPKDLRTDCPEHQLAGDAASR